MRGVTRGIGALLVLVGGLAGIPIALVALGGNPFPASFSWAELARTMTTPDDGTVLVGLIAVVGWVAWTIFALSVLAEVVSAVSRYRIRLRLPGLGGPQRFAAGLVLAVITMTTVPQLGNAQPPAPVAAVAPLATAVVSSTEPEPGPAQTENTAPADPAPAAPSGSGRHHRHEVKSGDDLWSLAEHYYGNGRDWRKIATANPDVLSGGPDRLRPGMVLSIPDVGAETVVDRSQVTVRRGDTLSSIADRELGAADRWPELFRANRAQLDDPNELEAGMRLVLPGSARDRQQDSAPRQRTEPTTETSASPDKGGESPTRPTREPAPTGSSSPEPAATPSSGASAEGGDAASPADPAEHAAIDTVVPLAGIGTLLAAGLLTGLAWRRRVQLQSRPVGRRVMAPSPAAVRVEVGLGGRQRPLSLRTLDRALRAVGAHSRATGDVPPPLELALVADDHVELVMAEKVDQTAPAGFTVEGRRWRLDRADVDQLNSVHGLSEALRPWPALVTLGQDEDDRQVLIDLERIGRLGLSMPTERAEELMAAMAVELSFSPWADEMILTLVGSCPGLPDALGKHNITRTDELDAVIERLERRATVQRSQVPVALTAHRIDPDLADPWAPEIVLINCALSPDQSRRLAAVIDGTPPVSLAVVVVGDSIGAWNLHPEDGGRVRLDALGMSLDPQRLPAPTYDAVVELLTATASDVTTPAPWWAATEAPPESPPPDNVAYLGRRFNETAGTDNEQEVIMNMVGRHQRSTGLTGADRTIHHPTLQLLGPIELLGATGPVPPRAAKQALEYCAWLLEHPGTTAQEMGQALQVAEGTRRSNMSRLRTWLGADEAGDPYLPDAYSGRIMLHPSVSSDWQRLSILVLPGVNRASNESLYAALDLVRGAPLADAAPGQWHWAEMLRTDMISCLRDIGVELSDRAITGGDIDLARWAATRALVAAPGDELLLTMRIRTEHRAGNTAETERLSLHLAAQARNLGVDLEPETVTLLQEVMEGRPRARLA